LAICVIIGTGFDHYCRAEDFGAALRGSLEMFSFVGLIMIPWNIFLAIALVLGLKALWPSIPSRPNMSALLILFSIGFAGLAGAFLAFLIGQPNPGACVSP
jgi:hypothetical protein